MHKLCLAPMVDRTDRHFRFLARLLHQDIFLYTEMLVDRALLKGDAPRLLRFHATEHPIGLQLAGTDPKLMAQAAVIGKRFSFDEININCGCPSPRASTASFGAALMTKPTLVADMAQAMHESSSLPISVKMRIGVDEQDNYDSFCHFVETVANAGVRVFIVHARKAWLCGLSVKENRTVPPLRYDWVYRLKADFPYIDIVINGGIATVDQIKTHLQRVDGVMLGRAAYANPWLLSQANELFARQPVSPPAVFAKLLLYAQQELEQGTRSAAIFRHWLHLFSGFPGAKQIRQKFSSANPEEVLTLLATLKAGEYP